MQLLAKTDGQLWLDQRGTRLLKFRLFKMWNKVTMIFLFLFLLQFFSHIFTQLSQNLSFLILEVRADTLLQRNLSQIFYTRLLRRRYQNHTNKGHILLMV